MSPRKNIWQMQHQTVCKVVGMALDFRELRKIAVKFGIVRRDPLMDEQFALHSSVVHLCGTDNRVSRHVQKLIERRFAAYSKRLSEVDAPDIVSTLTQTLQASPVPLWAVLWELATRRADDSAKLETALFGFIHMLEHRLLREFWESEVQRSGDIDEQVDHAELIASLQRQLLELKRENKTLEASNSRLEARLAQAEAARAQPGIHPITTNRSLTPVNPSNDRRMERLRSLLAEAQIRSRVLESEVAQLRAELRDTSRTLLANANERPIPDSAPEHCPCPGRALLSGQTIAMVGGIGSLECHYRELVEAMGGCFFRHDGECAGGEKSIEDCIRKADLVVCPIEVNSHHAARAVKRVCKAHDIPCCFPRSAGLTGLKTAIESFHSRIEPPAAVAQSAHLQQAH
ncbi:MAG: DUF2325 domain-containing protein [Thermodesulfobacteriota bacterium]